jgi:hypothetical protein
VDSTKEGICRYHEMNSFGSCKIIWRLNAMETVHLVGKNLKEMNLYFIHTMSILLIAKTLC